VVLGIGLGSVMQVLVLITQNAVPQNELGVATSGATFFRSIGGSFGAAIFGAIFSNVLAGKLSSQLAHIKGASPAALRALNPSTVTPAVLDKLPLAIRDAFINSYASSTQDVFLVAVPVAFIAFLFTWLIPHVELRGRASGAGIALAEGEGTIPTSELDGDGGGGDGGGDVDGRGDSDGDGDGRGDGTSAGGEGGAVRRGVLAGTEA
jgi:hypothetical protein